MPLFATAVLYDDSDSLHGLNQMQYPCSISFISCSDHGMRFALAACNSWRRCRLIVCFWLYHLFTCTWVSESAQDQYSVLNAKDVGQCLSIHHKISEPVMSNVVMPLPVQFKISSDHDVYSHAMHKWNTKKPEVFESDVGIIRRNAILAHTHKKNSKLWTSAQMDTLFIRSKFSVEQYNREA